jgi:hypothetical protein
MADALDSKSAELLGDPSFPRILAQAKQGERILRYQELYQQYSRLGLTNDFDRPTAIDALQQKLLRTMLVKGGWGVFSMMRYLACYAGASYGIEAWVWTTCYASTSR